jgi:hypothetical protein
MTDEQLKASYALAKQLSTAYAIESTYGTLALDEELRAALEKALRPILEKRTNENRNP